MALTAIDLPLKGFARVWEKIEREGKAVKDEQGRVTIRLSDHPESPRIINYRRNIISDAGDCENGPSIVEDTPSGLMAVGIQAIYPVWPEAPVENY